MPVRHPLADHAQVKVIRIKTIEWHNIWVIEAPPKCRFLGNFLGAVNLLSPIDLIYRTFVAASIASRSEILKALIPTTWFFHRPK